MRAVVRDMKHTPINPATADKAERAPTRRALAKHQTRLKVLEAARQLFSEQGYEGATIRDIATSAGMSTGAVFANFTDKGDLFRHIMVDDAAALLATMRQAAEHGRNIEDMLVRTMSAGYAFYLNRAQLARAAFTVLWEKDGRAALREHGIARAQQDLFVELLAEAAARGELIGEAQVDLRGQMLHDIYLANFPIVVFEQPSLEALEARARGQIHILLAGALPKAA